MRNMTQGLLIGTNCKKALKPKQVISSQGKGPYAKRTRLGWCVVGSTDFGSETIKSNNIRVCNSLREWTGDSSGTRHIVLEAKITDNAISDMLQEMWRSDFIEREGEEKGLSREDNQFVNLMKKRIEFKDGHYQQPLPLRNSSTHRPKLNQVHPLIVQGY